MNDYVAFILYFACIFLGCRGLEFTLHRDSLGHPASCGVLRCEERIPPGKGHADTTTSFSNINSMTIFKQILEVSKSDKPDDKRKVLVALITSQGAEISKGSTLLFDLAKLDNCSSEFICEVRGVDTQGHTLTSIATLQAQGQLRGNQDVGSLIETQLVSLVQQVHSKLAQVSSSMEDSKNSIGALQKVLGQDMTSIEHKLENKMVQVEKDLQDKIQSLETASSQRRLEDKLESLETRIENKLNHSVLDKLYQLDLKVSNFTTKMEFEKDTNNIIDASGKKLHGDDSNGLENICHQTEEIERGLANMSILLTSMIGRISKAAICPQLNLKETLGWDDFTGRMLNASRSSQQKVLNIIEQLKSTMYNNAVDALSSVIDEASVAQPDRDGHPQSDVSDKSNASRCERGMKNIVSHSPYPYPVVQPSRESGLDVAYLCDTLTDGGGWILIQRRTTGNTDFHRSWADYKNGFGSLDKDFWLGNDNIHSLTSAGTWELRVDLRYDNAKAFALYSDFSVEDERGKYSLYVGDHSGTLPDSLSEQKKKPFSTVDNDNDDWPDLNCAAAYGGGGGWWYSACDETNLNGKWTQNAEDGLEWKGFIHSGRVDFSEMKIRALR